MIGNDVRGFALVCDEAGNIRQILKDDLGLFDADVVGSPLAARLDPGSGPKAEEFIREANRNGAAFDWELAVPVNGEVRPLHFAAARAPDGALTVVGATSRSAVLRYYDELMRINNDQANALRTALKSRALDTARVRDDDLYDKLTQLNNELGSVQRELTKKNVELNRANEMKNQFVGMAAHDLRNPIGAIRSYASLLLDDDMQLSEAQSRGFLERIQSSCGFMLTLINDLLDLSAIESGRLRLVIRPMDLAQLLRDTVELMQVLAADKQIVIELRIDAGLGAFQGDGPKLEQVLHNLVGNAVKFSPIGATVVVRAQTAGDTVSIEVSDSGPGIPEDELESVFKPFQRGSQKSTAGERSTGLGLAIAKRVVEGHAGSLTCVSQVGRGSTFRVQLPVAGTETTGVGVGG